MGRGRCCRALVLCLWLWNAEALVATRFDVLDDSCDRRYEGGCHMYLCSDGDTVQGVGGIYRFVSGTRSTRGFNASMVVDGRLGLASALGSGWLEWATLRGWYNMSGVVTPWQLRESGNQTAIDAVWDCMWVPLGSTPENALHAEYADQDRCHTCSDNFQCLQPGTTTLFGTWTFPFSDSAPHVWNNCSWDVFVGIRSFDLGRSYYGNWTVAGEKSSGVALYRADFSGPVAVMRGTSGHPATERIPFRKMWFLVASSLGKNITAECESGSGSIALPC